jgi:hypothetical protein
MCPSATGLYTCNATCTAETFSPTIPAESCNGTDDNCNGVADDGFACVRSSTGNGCTTGCGTPGTHTCSTSCTPGTCAAAAETCNGCDDDVDGTPDDGFACRFGQSRSCSTSCGTSGTQLCETDCSGYEACRAAIDTCNGCDDDLDGEPDDGFACVRGRLYGCTVPACGTAGQQTCGSSCTLGACTAPAEICNYCDDDGDGSFQDDAGLASSYNQPTLRCTDSWRFSGAGTCTVDTTYLGGANSHFVYLGSVTAWEAHAAWRNLSFRVGWGPVRIRLTGHMRRQPGTVPGEGWALVLAKGGTGDTGGAGELGVPLTRTGMSLEWRFYDTMWWLDEPDRMRVRRLDGTGGPGTILGNHLIGYNLDPSSPETWPGVYFRIDSTYPPNDPRTPSNEEALLVTAGSGMSMVTVLSYNDLLGGTPGLLANEFPPGSTIEIGLVSSNGGATHAVRVLTEQYVAATGSWVVPYSHYKLENVCF